MTIEQRDADFMAEAVGETAFMYLGGFDVLHALNVEYYALDERAVVWVDLKDASFDAQLEAVSAFAEVRDCYSDELQLELRFGSPETGHLAPLVSARAVKTA